MTTTARFIPSYSSSTGCPVSALSGAAVAGDTVLLLDGLPVPLLSRLEVTQRYEVILPTWFRRVADNTGVLRSTGTEKIATTISGRGWMPPALQALSPGSVHTIGCIAWRDVISEASEITLPAERRIDDNHRPVGYAVVGSDLVPAVEIGTVDDIMTLGSVSGASHYVAYYLPLISARIVRAENQTESSAQHSWTLEAEQF